MHPKCIYSANNARVMICTEREGGEYQRFKFQETSNETGQCPRNLRSNQVTV